MADSEDQQHSQSTELSATVAGSTRMRVKSIGLHLNAPATTPTIEMGSRTQKVPAGRETRIGGAGSGK